ILNYLLPRRGVLPMHCSANVGEAGDVAQFFGLTGTGKTTLSADPERALIGDDEHGWSDSGVFNFEGGCYAKVIRLSREGEPEIYATTRMFGTVLENVVVDPATRAIDLESAEITENTRASYPIHFIPNHVPGGVAGHPAHIVFLTCDAYGIMPPIARLCAPRWPGSSTAPPRRPTRSSGSRCRCRCPACQRRCCCPAARGAMPPPTTPRPCAWHACSRRTSSSSKTRCITRSGTPDR